MATIDALSRRRGRAARRLVKGAIFAIGAIAAFALLKSTSLRRRTSVSPMEALAAAAPPTRSVVGRLTGFPYRPFADHRFQRDATKASLKRLRLLGVAEIEATGAPQPSATQLHAVGVSVLLREGWAGAVSTLESVVEQETGESDTAQAISKTTDVSLLNDLSVAYLALATHQNEPLRIMMAIECAERAWEQSHAPEPAWNRAMAFEAMHLRHQARVAWAAYLKIDGASSWSAEASQHLLDLSGNRTTQTSLAVAPCDSAAASVREVERERFPQWARAVTEGNAQSATLTLESIRKLANSAAPCTRDHSIARFAQATAVRAAEDSVALAGAHIEFENAQRLYEKGDYHGAESHLRHAEPLFNRFDDPFRWRATVLAASCSYYRNQFVSADRLASLVIEQPLSEIGLPLFAHAHWIRGSSRGARGLVYEAIDDYQAAEAAFASMNDSEGTLGVETMLSAQLEAAGESADAWGHRIGALDLASRRAPTVQMQLLLLQMARLAIRDGQRTAARAFLDEQLAESGDHPDWSDLRVRALLLRADVEQQSGRKDAAHRDREDAFMLASTIPSEDVRFFTSTSADYVSARAAEGLDDDGPEIQAATHYARTHRHNIRLSELLMLNGRAYRRRGDSKAAREAVEEALHEIESQGRAIRTTKGRDAFFESRSRIYFEAIGIALESKDPDWAFRLSEFSRSEDSISLSAVQRAVPIQAAIVKFAVLPDRLLIWLIRRERVLFLERSVTSAQLERAVGSFVTRLRASDDLPDDDELYGMLVAPWLEAAAGVDVLAIVAEGAVGNVPFCALHGPGAALLERFQISYAPSVAISLARRAARAASSTALVVAPDSDGSSLGELPQATEEAVRVAALYRGAILLVSRDVTRERLVGALADSTLVHFAGHAVANQSDPRLSALLVRDSRGAPAYLYAHEIAALPLRHVSLVVLAACSTASVPRGRRAGLASLAYAFSAAGAHFVVGTLWPITDDAGARVSIDLHSRLRRGSAPSAALREIQLESLHRSPPRDWAGFVGVGGLDGYLTKVRIDG